jgi:hypothetical protein
VKKNDLMICKMLFVLLKLNCEKSLIEFWRRETYNNDKSTVKKLYVIIFVMEFVLFHTVWCPTKTVVLPSH